MKRLILCVGLGVALSLACTMRANEASSQHDEWCRALGGRVQQYSIVIAPDVKTLKARVSDAIAHGWQPTGGLAVSPEGLCQVVVK